MSIHVGNFETVLDSRFHLLQRQAKDTFEAAKKGYELTTMKTDKQSMEAGKVLTNARESFGKMKQDMDASKLMSQGELQAMQDAIKKKSGTFWQ